MKWFGLTGGIASGKSTVARMLAERGVHVIDADVVAREVVEPGAPALQALAEAFGAEVLSADGSLDRARLGALVFADPDARARLNAITHPAIAARTGELLSQAREQGLPFVVYDAALIVENRIHEMMDGLVVVHVPRATQLERLVGRDEIDLDAARQRLDAQLDPDQKVAVADWVIDNSKTPDETEEQVERLVAELRARADEH